MRMRIFFVIFATSQREQQIEIPKNTSESYFTFLFVFSQCKRTLKALSLE